MTSADTTPAARPVLPTLPAPLVTPRMPVLVVAAHSRQAISISISTAHSKTADGMPSKDRAGPCMPAEAKESLVSADALAWWR